MGAQRRIIGVAAAMTLAVAGAGCGGGMDHDSMSHGSSAGTGTIRTVDVTMRDVMYDPPAVTVQDGATVTIVFHNAGKIRHDAFLGDEAAQAEHEKKMGMSSTSMGGHMDDDAISVEPGAAGSLTHTFKMGDTLVIGCHEPGHYAAGMKLAIVVT
jgi:uncharacterized cupredoxin-like copper-binding protein